MANWQEMMPSTRAYLMNKVLYELHHNADHLEAYKTNADAYLARFNLPDDLAANIKNNDVAEMYLSGSTRTCCAPTASACAFPKMSRWPRFAAFFSARNTTMAKITGIYTASHTPVMLNFPDRIPAALRDEIFGAYAAMGQDFMAGKPDVLLVLSNDHLHNFFLDNFPAFCFGCAESYESRSSTGFMPSVALSRATRPSVPSCCNGRWKTPSILPSPWKWCSITAR